LSDISDRVALEEQLRKAQKMESITQLAAGVAHDFNNLLTIVQGYTNLLLAESHDTEVIDSMKKVSLAAERATTLTRQLLTFGRRQTMMPEPIALNELVNNVACFLRHILGDKVQLQMQLGAEIHEIMADAAMIERRRAFHQNRNGGRGKDSPEAQ
jgi:signal transduction histidine kinase